MLASSIRIKPLILDHLSLIIPVGASLFFIVFLLLPSLSALPSRNIQISSKKAELVNLRVRLQKLNELIVNQSKLKSSLGLIDFAIPSSDDVPLMMTQVQAVAGESNVNLKALQFGSGATGLGGNSSKIPLDKRVKRVYLQAVAEGSFVDLQSFLRNLERASRIITVESLSFESRKNANALTANLTLVGYYTEKFSSGGTEVDLSSRNFKTVLEEVRALKVYQSEVSFSAIGKSNPFE